MQRETEEIHSNHMRFLRVSMDCIGFPMKTIENDLKNLKNLKNLNNDDPQTSRSQTP